MSLVLCHAAEVISEPATDGEDGEHLEKVRQRRGILERMRGVGVRVAAAVGAEHLDGDLRSHRTLDNGLLIHFLVHHDRHVGHDRLSLFVELRHVHHHRRAAGHHELALLVQLGRLDRHRHVRRHGLAFVVGLSNLNVERLREPGFGVGLEVLNHALRHEHESEHQADGQEQVIGNAHQVHPEVADRPGRVPRQAPDQRGRDRDPGRGGNEVVEGQPNHLGEIGHRGFPHVALPVGVRRETGRRVERKVGTQRSEPLWIQRQQVLQPQDGIGEQAAHKTEQQHGQRVLFPIVLLAGIHAHQAISEPFQWSQHGVKPCPTVGIKHPHEIKPHRLGDHRERRDEENELQPA